MRHIPEWGGNRPVAFLLRKTVFVIVAALTVVAAGTGASYAVEFNEGDPSPPAERSALEMIPKEKAMVDGEMKGPMFDLRNDAMKEAALSYGARGGLIWRTYHIRKELEMRASYLDKVYDFRNLLIPAPSGLLIEPPVISEQVNAMLVDGRGQEAAVADRVYNIVNNARIVSAPRTWRNYLERDWGELSPPPDILRPNDAEEREKWIGWIREGWQLGIEQANEIFQEDLNELAADYQGMIRYRMLLAQGMVTPPYALQVDRGITGGGKEMRVGDRAVRITETPALSTGADRWQPANR